LGAAVRADLGAGGGITLAVLRAIASFAIIPYYPIWSLLIIAGFAVSLALSAV
jgi:hypothetical protein